MSDYVDARNNVENEAAMFEGIAQSGLRGVSVTLATVQRNGLTEPGE